MKRTFIKILSALFPAIVVKLAYKNLTSPQVKKLRENELKTLEKAKKSNFDFKGFNIQTYHWQGGEKKVLLIHGWEGQAGNFSDIIEELMNHDYSIYAFDGPSHGFSSTGRTSLFEFTELVGLMIKKFNVTNLISHSFGGVATTYSLYSNQDIFIDKYLLLTTPDKFTERIDDVSDQVGISERVKQKLIRKLEKELNVNTAGLNVSDFVKEVNVKTALIIHDVNDKVIPIARSRNVYNNWPNCEFREISGTGHFRILRTKTVIDEVMLFLN